jgi:glutathione S-transferase
VLDDHLKGRAYVVGDALTIADFAVGITLPYAEDARIPLAEFPEIERWHRRLSELPAWREPFPARRAAA